MGLTKARLQDSVINAVQNISERNELNLMRENVNTSQIASQISSQYNCLRNYAKSAATSKRPSKMETQYVEERGNKYDFIKKGNERRRSSMGSEAHWEP